MFNSVHIKMNSSYLFHALQNMQDKEGKKWKRAAFSRAGSNAFKPVKQAIRARAPYLSGLTKRSIGQRSKYNRMPSQATSSKPVTSKGFRHEYMIYNTLTPTFYRNAPKDKKGRAARYPFMQEVGIPAQTYTRSDGTKVKRTAQRKPLLFMHRGLAAAAPRAERTFKQDLGRFLNLYAKKQYSSLPKAIKSNKER